MPGKEPISLSHAGYNVTMPRIVVSATYPVRGAVDFTSMFIAQIKRIVAKYQGYVLGMLEETTETWNNETPRWQKPQPTFSGGDVVASVTADPKTDWGATKWAWLDGGTDENWAFMTAGFQAKTSPGLWKPEVGVGGLSYVRSKKNKGGVGPNPGIEARQWSEFFAEYWSDYGYEEMMAEDVENAVIELADRFNEDNYNRIYVPEPPPSGPENIVYEVDWSEFTGGASVSNFLRRSAAAKKGWVTRRSRMGG